MTREEFERQIVVPMVTELRLNKMKSKAVWISCILAALFCAHPANASVVMTLDQSGPNVVATANGTLDVTDLTLISAVELIEAGVSPRAAYLAMTPIPEVPFTAIYTGVSGPASFGPGTGLAAATFTSGQMIGIAGIAGTESVLYTSFGGYATPLFATATWVNTTIGGLGVTPGIYTWTWGSGDHADSLTFFAGVPVSTPEPTTWSLLVFSFAELAGVAYRRRNLTVRHMNR